MKDLARRTWSIWSARAERLTAPRNRIGMNIFRVLSSCVILMQYMLNYSQRQFLYGPNGVVPWDLFLLHKQGFSLYQLSSEPIFFEVLYHAGIVVTALWGLGILTRWLTPLTFVFWYSLRQTNTLLWDGGDNLMQVMFVFAVFADLSPLGGRQPAIVGSRTPLHQRIAAIVHNGAVTCFGLQLCIVYGVSALAKVQGETWQNGTALYYALWPEQFRFPGLSQLVFRDARLLVVVSYLTVYFQLAFPFFYWLNRSTRHLAVLAGVCFHLGIAGIMGLFSFAGFMIAAELALVGEEAYLRLYRLARSTWARLFGQRTPAADVL